MAAAGAESPLPDLMAASLLWQVSHLSPPNVPRMTSTSAQHPLTEALLHIQDAPAGQMVHWPGQVAAPQSVRLTPPLVLACRLSRRSAVREGAKQEQSSQPKAPPRLTLDGDAVPAGFPEFRRLLVRSACRRHVPVRPQRGFQVGCSGRCGLVAGEEGSPRPVNAARASCLEPGCVPLTPCSPATERGEQSP